MNKDLEATLRELGPDYRRLVRRVRTPFEEARPRRFAAWKVGYLTAAGVVLVAGLAILWRPAPAKIAPPRIYTVAYAADAGALQAIVASQRADGSWETDFLTRQNAAFLGKETTSVARVAYLRARRYLRRKGLAPFTDAELEALRDTGRGSN